MWLGQKIKRKVGAMDQLEDLSSRANSAQDESAAWLRLSKGRLSTPVPSLPRDHHGNSPLEGRILKVCLSLVHGPVLTSAIGLSIVLPVTACAVQWKA